MSLHRIMKDIQDREAGVLSRYRLSYRYSLVKNTDKAYQKLFKQMNKNPIWTLQTIKKRFIIQVDRLDREYLISFSKSVLCKDPEKESIYPLVEKDGKDPFFTVPMTECKKCQHFVYRRDKSICKLHREMNKGLFVSTLKSAADSVNKMMRQI